MNKGTVIEFSIPELKKLAKDLKKLTNSTGLWRHYPLRPGDKITINKNQENEVIIKIVDRKIEVL